MVVREFYKKRNDGVSLYRTYSDIDLVLVQNETGVLYAEAIDIEDAPYTYSETDEVIVRPELPEEVSEPVEEIDSNLEA